MYGNKYLKSGLKRILDLSFSLIILLITLPLMVVTSVAIYIFSGNPIFFTQRRAGKNGKIFKILKFRTMILDAEKIQSKYQKLNESDGPVFKIKNDPRFTSLGKLLSKTGFDELPQMINVVKGEMSLVGPRPLPVDEYSKLSKSQRVRQKALPGITSTWVVNGSHAMPFKKWMELDREYVEKATLTTDLEVIVKTMVLVGNFLLKL